MKDLHHTRSLRDDLKEVVSNAVNNGIEGYKRESEKKSQHTEKYLYGISGLAKFLEVSYPTALKIKTIRRLSYIKAGRKFIFNVEQVLEELKEAKS